MIRKISYNVVLIKESIISCFDRDLLAAVVENVTVGVDGKLTFGFKNGAETVK